MTHRIISEPFKSSLERQLKNNAASIKASKWRMFRLVLLNVVAAAFVAHYYYINPPNPPVMAWAFLGALAYGLLTLYSSIGLHGTLRGLRKGLQETLDGTTSAGLNSDDDYTDALQEFDALVNSSGEEAEKRLLHLQASIANHEADTFYRAVRASDELLESSKQSYLQLQERCGSLEAAMQEFVDRVDRGEVRSRKTYAKFKELLEGSADE